MIQKTIRQSKLIPQVSKGVDELHDFMVTMFWQDGEQGRAGSGVLVYSCGVHGILTCHHVSKPLMEFEKFALSIADHPHSLWVNTAHVEHLVIAEMNKDEKKLKDGPDLSFIIIRDVKLLAIIKSKKSFTNLDTQDISIFKNRPLKQIPWGVVGCPFLNSVYEKQANSLTVGLRDFAGMAKFRNRKVRKSYDYLQLGMPSDGKNYPEDFKGLSGGGMWAINLKGPKENPTPENVTHARPVLAGITFFQSLPNKKWRTVTGHGFDSIHGRFKKKLRQHLRRK